MAFNDQWEGTADRYIKKDLLNTPPQPSRTPT